MISKRKNYSFRKTARKKTSKRCAIIRSVNDCGKMRSSKNAIKHGLLSKNLVVSGEKMSEYQAFRQNLIETFRPEGTMEALLVEKIACLPWRQRKAIQVKSSLFHKGLSSEWNRKSLKSFFQARDGDCLQYLSRYEANIEKKFIGRCIN